MWTCESPRVCYVDFAGKGAVYMYILSACLDDVAFSLGCLRCEATTVCRLNTRWKYFSTFFGIHHCLFTCASLLYTLLQAGAQRDCVGSFFALFLHSSSARGHCNTWFQVLHKPWKPQRQISLLKPITCTYIIWFKPLNERDWPHRLPANHGVWQG